MEHVEVSLILYLTKVPVLQPIGGPIEDALTFHCLTAHHLETRGYTIPSLLYVLAN